MAHANEQRVVGVGEYYTAKDGGELVCVFSITRDEVAFAPVGKSSESRLSQEDFLKAYDYRPAPKPTKEDIEATKAVEATL